MIEERLLDRLKSAQAEIVEGMINFPADDLMKHHRLVGQHQGLEKAIELLTELLSGKEDE